MKYSATSRRSSSRRSDASCPLNRGADSHDCASFALFWSTRQHGDAGRDARGEDNKNSGQVR